MFVMEESNPIHNPIIPSFKIFKHKNRVKVDATFYKKVVGCLIYLTTSQSYLKFVVSFIIRYIG